MPGQVPFQRVQIVSRRIHILGINCCVQPVKHSGQLIAMFGLDASGTACKKKSLKSFVGKTLYHNVTSRVTLVNGKP